MLNQISFFQLDNLIKNRIPFTLINLGPSLKDLYTSIYRTHVESHELMSESIDHAMQQLEAKKTPNEAALLVICQDGKQSSKLSMELAKKSYTNVYLINGGYQQLMTERSQV
jgi:rhodanese-related sulfurtransferase